MWRHGRQTKLVEVGAAGQARIVGARVAVAGGGLASEVAARYLAGAGVGHLRVSSNALAALARAVDPAIEVEVTPQGEAESHEGALPLELRDPAARALAEGAYVALRALRAALKEPS